MFIYSFVNEENNNIIDFIAKINYIKNNTLYFQDIYTEEHQDMLTAKNDFEYLNLNETETQFIYKKYLYTSKSSIDELIEKFPEYGV